MVETVLGLSLTSTSIGWVLLDGPDADADTLDHDAFDLGANSPSDGDITKHTAAVRGAQSIAASTGHEVTSIGVTWTDDADAKATLLLKALPDLGFDNVVTVKLAEATRTWARAYGRTLEFEKCALCVVESAAVTALSFGYDSVRTFSTQMRESADGLSRWLIEMFEKNKLQPDALYLIGARGDVGLIYGSVAEALPVPVDASDDAQLALARGAALAVTPKSVTVSDANADDAQAVGKPARRWARLRQSTPAVAAAKPDHIEAWTEALKKPAGKATAKPTTEVVEPKTEVVETRAEITEAPAVELPPKAAAPETAVVETKTEVVDKPIPSSPVVAKQVIEAPARDEPTKRRWRYGPHARAGTAVVAGVIALFFIVPTLMGPKDSTTIEDPAASDAATTSVSVHAVPSLRQPAPAAVRQAADRPAPILPPPPVAPPPAPAVEAAPAADTAAPIEEPVTAPVTAEPMVATQAPAAASEPVAPEPPAAPVDPGAAQPMAAPAAPIALPAEAPAAAPPPAPAAAPPPPGEPVPAPPQDPLMQVLSPLFGALP